MACGGTGESVDSDGTGGDTAASGGAGAATGGAASSTGAAGAGAASGGDGGIGGGSGASGPGVGGSGVGGSGTGSGGNGSGGAISGPIDIAAELPELSFDCEADNPCVYGGSCAGDTNPCTGSYRVGTPEELQAIAGCTSIEGDLEIRIPELSNLPTLSLLTVGGTLAIYGNESLTSLQGLESLQSVGSLRLGISLGGGVLGNALLQDLHGLEGLRAIPGMAVRDHDALVSLQGLSLTKLGALNLDDDTQLADLSALSQLSCLGALGISGLSLLENLDALSGVRVESLYIQRTFLILRRGLRNVSSGPRRQPSGKPRVPRSSRGLARLLRPESHGSGLPGLVE